MQNRLSLISLPAAISIGIGSMIGAGIFSILGVVATASGSAMWVSFLIGGIIALFSTYSYAKLGVKYPTAGGAVQFLVAGYGKGAISGTVNIFMWLGYIISIALYADGFASYALTFFTDTSTLLMKRLVATGIIVAFTAMNMLGAKTMGKAELFIVSVKVTILVLFAATGLFFINPTYLATSAWSDWQHIFFGAGVLFIGYEGFGLITNAAGDMANPQTMLPKALFMSVFIVIAIYVAVSIAVIGNLTPNQILATGDYALAAAAQPFLGMLGFKLIAFAALFSTASAINATLFGAANICYMAAQDGELPAILDRHSWDNAPSGLLITSFLSVLFVLMFDLAGIAMMGSGAFLLIYAAVNAGHLKILAETGANKWVVMLALALCLVLFAFLECYTYQHAPVAVYTMLVMLVSSYIIYRYCRS